MRILRIFNELMREGTLPDEPPSLFLVGRETGTHLHGLSARNDEEDQETPFQDMDAQQLAETTAWLRLFVRQASKRG
jgi:hypothetical protein